MPAVTDADADAGFKTLGKGRLLTGNPQVAELRLFDLTIRDNCHGDQLANNDQTTRQQKKRAIADDINFLKMVRDHGLLLSWVCSNPMISTLPRHCWRAHQNVG